MSVYRRPGETPAPRLPPAWRLALAAAVEWVALALLRLRDRLERAPR